jgi:hypothetical protein
VVAGITLLRIVDVVVGMSMIMVVVARSVGVTVATEDKETDKVG